MTVIQEHNEEASPGLPGPLPVGERVLWQGSPDWRVLARSKFHIRKLAVYFLIIIGAHQFTQMGTGATAESMVASGIAFTALAALALGIVALYARMSARATLFTVTTRRIVIRSGVALSLTANIPFSQIETADVRDLGDDFGDIAITPTGGASYVLLWPYVRPWRFFRAQPMLRSISEAGNVADVLAHALRDEPREHERQLDVIRSSPPQPELETEPDHDHNPLGRNQKLPLAAAAGLIGFALIATAAVVLSGNAPKTYAESEVVRSVDVLFVHKDDDTIDVIDAATGGLMETIEPGDSGFLRSTVGVFERYRSLIDPATVDTPFNLRWTANGRLFLFDPIRDAYVDVMAFGAPNAEIFLKLLPGEPGTPSTESGFTNLPEGAAGVPTAALTDQDGAQ